VVYDHFLEAVAGRRPVRISGNLRIHLVHQEGSPTRSISNSTSQQRNLVRTECLALQKHPRRSWTLNEKQGYYVATGLKDHVIDLTLLYKKLDRQTTTVGQFLLDLESLSKNGLVGCRAVAGKLVFDVRIVRDHSGSFWLGVRNNRAISLQTLARA
jgi:hypothetical protein